MWIRLILFVFVSFVAALTIIVDWKVPQNCAAPSIVVSALEKTRTPKLYYTSYAHGDAHYFQMQRKHCNVATTYGLECVLCNISSIPHSYVKRNALIFKEARGAGLWNWKPICVFQAMEQMAEGDLLLYMDVGSVLLKDPAPLFTRARRDDLAFFVDCPHKIGQWVTRPALALLGGEMYRKESMILGGYHVWRKSPRARLFLSEWLTYVQDWRIIYGSGDSRLSNLRYQEFRDHRHDMAPLSVLVHRWNLTKWRNPSQWGETCRKEYPNSDDYPQLLLECGPC